MVRPETTRTTESSAGVRTSGDSALARPIGRRRRTRSLFPQPGAREMPQDRAGPAGGHRAMNSCPEASVPEWPQQSAGHFLSMGQSRSGDRPRGLRGHAQVRQARTNEGEGHNPQTVVRLVTSSRQDGPAASLPRRRRWRASHTQRRTLCSGTSCCASATSEKDVLPTYAPLYSATQQGPACRPCRNFVI
jgi:hypothetical protein